MSGGGDVNTDVHALVASVQRLRAEIGKRVVGQDAVVDEILMALVAGGHALLVGVPGLAKTLMIKSLADAMALEFRRIQFTPDLVPSDITGTEILEESGGGSRAFRFVRGPVFANIVLADEINRAPPRTQAALLEAMQEHSVTAAGQTMRLPEPFFVLATQNPIEQEGTYPLPEAQLDRFLFDIRVGYPTEAEEVSILRATTAPWCTHHARLYGRRSPRTATRRARDAVQRIVAAVCGASRTCHASTGNECAGDRLTVCAVGRWSARWSGADSGRQGSRLVGGAGGGVTGGYPSCRHARVAASYPAKFCGGSRWCVG